MTKCSVMVSLSLKSKFLERTQFFFGFYSRFESLKLGVDRRMKSHDNMETILQSS